MPMMLGSKGKDILQWRASTELLATLKERLKAKLGRSSEAEAESFLRKLIDALQEELGYEEELARECSALDEALDAASSLEELHPILARYRELLSAHFRRRLSVLAFCGACNRLHDRIVAAAASVAISRMQQSGQGKPPLYALLVSGDRGRQEETLFAENRYFLLHEEDDASFFLFSRRFSLALKELGLLSCEQMFWHGSLSQWNTLLQDGLSLRQPAQQESAPFSVIPFAAPPKLGPQDLPDWEWRLEAMSDLCQVAGDARLAARAMGAAAATLRNEAGRPPFQQLARRVIGLPLGSGRFGRWRLQREGEHRGELNLDEYALGPLVMTVRVLAVQAGVPGEGTTERIQALLERGALNVELAERLFKAYQYFMQLKILSEIRNEQAGAFCNPDELDPAEEDLLRSSLEAVLNLQKIAYQRMVGQG